LITASLPLTLVEGMKLQLDGLSAGDSQKLLINHCARTKAFASELARICHDNPVCLLLIAGYLAENPTIRVDQCLAELRNGLARWAT
jgi:hypothetical protein